MSRVGIASMSRPGPIPVEFAWRWWR